MLPRRAACARRRVRRRRWTASRLPAKDSTMQLTAILTTSPSVTRILVRADDDVVLKAALLPRCWPHRRALPSLLESLALWHQARAHVVISASDLDSWSRLGLVDDLGVAAATIHYEVE